MPDSRPPSWAAQIKGPAIATAVALLIGALFTQASGMLTLPSRVDKIDASIDADQRDREARRQENAGRLADIERRVRTVEDDNRDQRAPITGLQSGQITVATKLDDFIRDQRDRLDKQQVTLTRIEATLDNLRGPLAPGLSADRPLNPRRPR